MKVTEVHHIKYRSQGGSDDPENLIELDFIEHAELHAWDFINGGPWFDMRLRGAKYLSLMVQDMVYKEQSRRTSQRNQKMVENGTHPSYTERHRKMASKQAKLLCSQNGTDSLWERNRLEKLKSVHDQVRVCPHCGKQGTGTAMLRWHFNNCKNNETIR